MVFWPKMLGVNPVTKMTFEVELEGEVEKIENPSRFAPLKLMVESYEKIIAGRDSNCEPIKWRQHLGKLPPRQVWFLKESIFNWNNLRDDVSKAKSSHCPHEKVGGGIVKYYHGPEKPNHNVEYGGVFATEESADGVFC